MQSSGILKRLPLIKTYFESDIYGIYIIFTSTVFSKSSTHVIQIFFSIFPLPLTPYPPCVINTVITTSPVYYAMILPI